MPAASTGTYFTSYRRELNLRHTKAEYFRLGLIVVALIATPYLLDFYWLSIVNTILIAVIGAVGLNLLVGFAGQISLGQGGFLAVGAFSSALLYQRADMPAPLSIACAVVITAVAGALFGLPALRIRGLYLAIATLASQEIIVFVARRWDFLRDGASPLTVDRLHIGGFEITRELFEWQWYWILLGFAVVAVLAARNLMRSSLGRSFMAVRDQDIAAEAIGINVTRVKLTAFAISSGFVGLAGALSAHYTETVTWESFTLEISILYLAMIIVGGLGSIAGAVYGAIFMMMVPVLLNEFLTRFGENLPWMVDRLPAIENGVFGLVIIVFLLAEPRGLDRIWQRLKDFVRHWPFRY
ncbi:MAG: branched-chain amino acid ABC transporter permease [Nocardioidaceae bacterium]|nr:branched-chain amino acid ABC transporter permease [Nocardioidaceae bacterium]